MFEWVTATGGGIHNDGVEVSHSFSSLSFLFLFLIVYMFYQILVNKIVQKGTKSTQAVKVKTKQLKNKKKRLYPMPFYCLMTVH